MTALNTERYAHEPNHDGTYSITDTLNGELVGTTPDEREAAKTVQRMNALHLANTIRLARGAVKREIHGAPTVTASCETCAAVIEDNPPLIASMRAEALIRCVRRMHRSRRDLILAYAECSNVRLMSELTARQRVRLVDALRMSTRDLSFEVSGMRQAMRKAVAS